MRRKVRSLYPILAEFLIFNLAFAYQISKVDISGKTLEIKLTWERGLSQEVVSQQAFFLAVEPNERPAVKKLSSQFSDDFSVSFGSEIRMRDLIILPVIIEHKAEGRELEADCEVLVELEFSENAKRRLSRAAQPFLTLYKSAILNFDWEDTELEPEGYLIIVPDEFYNNILPLAQWKERKGFYTWVKRKSEVGSTPQEIKSFIANSYWTYSPKPVYVLLVGSKEKMPFFSFPGVPATDYFYACIEGNDNFADILIGRLPAANSSELDVMVAKILNYEQTPYLADTLWYKRALTIATTYQEGGGRTVTALTTKRWVRELLLNNGFYKVDTVFHDLPPYPNPDTIRVLTDSGILFFNGRGWGNFDGYPYPRFYRADVARLNNGWKLPIVTSITCGTGNFNVTPSFGSVWLSIGTPTNPKGAVAFFGSSSSATSTRWNNCLDYGIYWGILKEGITSLDAAMYRGRVEVFRNFPLVQDSSILREFMLSYNLLGDPSLSVWTRVPKQLFVEHPREIPLGSKVFTVRVRDGQGISLKGALVSLLKDNEVKSVGYTDGSGLVAFNIMTQTEDTLFITVTKPNYLPYQSYALVEQSGLYVGYYRFRVGEINPGSSVNLEIDLKNYGNTSTAYNVSGILRADDRFITITDSVKSYGDIPPGGISSSGPFRFNVAPTCTNNHGIRLSVETRSGDSIWNSGLVLRVAAPELVVLRHNIFDRIFSNGVTGKRGTASFSARGVKTPIERGLEKIPNGNGYLDPGEIAEISVLVKNSGRMNAVNTAGRLRSLSSAVTVLDSFGTFGNIVVGDSVTNDLDRFRLRADSAVAVGKKITLILVLTGQDFSYQLNFTLTIGEITSHAPLGPCLYGYYAYDNTDTTFPEHPNFSWIEIDPNYGGSGTRLSLRDDDVKVLNLPFVFKYYGREYTKISICDNGYCALDSTWLQDPYNWRIPSPLGPPNLIATFWDNFHPDTLDASGVYYYYDTPNNRFIIEWSRVKHYHSFSHPYLGELQTFQVILYDPRYYPTRTGDGEILFQYLRVYNDDSFPGHSHNYATVGIKNFDNTIGLEWTYANRYPPGATVIDSGRAIKWTTDMPDTFIAIREAENSEFGIRNSEFVISPNPFRNSTVFRIPHSAFRIPHSAIRIYDVTGKLVKSFSAVGGRRSAVSGIVWDGKDKAGIPVSPGIYFVTLKKESSVNFIIKVIRL